MNKRPILPTDISFSHVADMYLAELRNGKVIPVEKLIAALPHLESEIREQLPALALLERAMGKKADEVEVDSASEIAGCRLIREVGRGAVGVVFEAHDGGLDRKVAIKLIPLQGTETPIAIDRFELERRAMARLEHPHIVPVYSSGFTKKSAYLVIKLIEGSSLYALQKGSGDFRTRFHFSAFRSNWDSLATLGLNVASGLHHAHQQGLVHRDIKPGNLLLDQDGKVWISDFGLAKVFDLAKSLSRTGDAIGTPRYMAPEQFRGVCDARSDVYALGITLYELASGKFVWSDKSSVSLITGRDSIELPNLKEVCPEVPDELCKIIMKACQFSPDDRYQTADEMCIVLDRFLHGKSKADRRVRKRLPDEVYRKKARRETVIACLAVMLVSFFIGTYVFVGRAPNTNADATRVENRPQLSRSAVGLIDKLADRDQDDMVKIVADFVEQSLSESGQKLQFSEPAKQEIRNQVDKITTQIKTTGLTEESLGKFLDGYRKTSLPIATKVMRLAPVIASSGLSVVEKKAAIETLRALGAAAVNGYVSERDVDAIVSKLIGFQPKLTTEITAMVIPDQRLRVWLGDLTGYLKVLPAAAFVYKDALNKELREVFDGAFGPFDQSGAQRTGNVRGTR